MTDGWCLLLLCAAYCTSLAWGQKYDLPRHPAGNEEPAVFRISFPRKNDLRTHYGFTSIAPGYQCAGDGTVFFTGLFQPSITSPPAEVLVSESVSGEAHEFRLDQIHDLHDVQQKTHYAVDSTVILLVIAAAEEKREKVEFTIDDGTKHEVVENTAEHHDYILVFDRSGAYKGRVKVDDSLAVHRVGVFPSGDFLIYGFDKQDHAPKLAMLGNDGTLLRLLEIPRNAAPKSVFRSQDKKGPAIFIRPVQFVPSGYSIVVVQNGTEYPLLEVSEAGIVRAIRPELPKREEIEWLIPSDHSLFLQTHSKPHSALYEINAEDGKALRKFELPDDRFSVACIHDGKFLSFEHKANTLSFAIGTAMPIKNTPLVGVPND